MRESVFPLGHGVTLGASLPVFDIMKAGTE